ncbi:hypothetical protein E3P92_00202 [Wallemia ichthyophaga]|uniref:RRM domain-containing protein n=2 Tax=Wallemia ichthyophaga TaxID=245174 RepID=A0A4T0FXN7_WALIC|nr:Single-stranded TG1-3 DNA-binding protein [Wallemia ichthyophaga EXF-994]TIA75326.1 hypothetical protein E3P91_00477 [Wallemia ichthyophaga]EOR04892.1 Single-stranded TG1-3 DNA-binding protein [Wallemia ichthyophaga EXF-994]TIA84134.1 hypothetical protein E3P98_00345 [Wallemia ichthyophaga]TIA93518.1 hypothetical protein E3P97_00895 [Wallemia ichthyophaga]TIB00725.1 hypothetical protein E3P95_01586 [Wallemia ichthyophaga]
MSQAPPVETHAAQAVEAHQPAEAAVLPTLKVFVGNLPFSVKDDGLKDLCKEHGEITDAQIIRFGSRSKGFGFVDYATKEQAETAVKALNGQDYQGRNIVVEIARPKEPKPERSQRIDDSAAPGEEDGSDKPKSRKPRKQQKKKQQQKKAAAAAAAENNDEAGVEQVDSTPAQSDAQQPKSEEENSSEKKAGNKKRSQRKRQASRQSAKPLGEPLADSVFVDNLPFRHYQGDDQPKIPFRDQQLRELFESKGLEVDQVRVVNRSNPLTKRSRGLGFVQLKKSTDQEKAINELNGSVVGRRTITVKVAKQRLDGENKEDTNQSNENNEQKEQPPAKDASAPTTESNEKKD